MLSLADILSREKNEVLLDMHQEIITGVIPKDGHTHEYCKMINKMIDSGDCRVNLMTYRKVYVPTMVKAVQKEMAIRFARILTGEDYILRQKYDVTQEDIDKIYSTEY